MSKAWRFGDDVDTDVIIPARYLNQPSPEHLAAHCMEDVDVHFAQEVQPGDVQLARQLSRWRASKSNPSVLR